MYWRHWIWMASTALLLTGCRPAASSKQAIREEKAAIAIVPPSASRQIYPWSVVPGGVDSPTAMKQAIQADPVVAAHYAGLHPGRFHAERLPAKRQGYVSYRIRDKIFWTRRMVTLLAGESVLTDGESMVRGRCGNLVSSIPHLPVAPESSEPDESVMDVPVNSSQLEAMPPVETAKLYNSKEVSEAKNTPAILPTTQAEEPLPPVWVVGGNTRPAVGLVAVPAGPSVAGSPGTPTSPMVTPPINGALMLPPLHPSVPIEVPPPLVLVSLVNTPPPPQFYSPDVLVSNVVWPRPTYTGVPSSPPSDWQPPGDSPLPPGNPPPSTPPSDTTPPSPPPPGGDAPPNGNPPPSDPPLDPRLSPPSDIEVPEPGFVLLLLLGLAGIAVGTSRRKT